METTIKCKKLNMSQVFTKNGEISPVTILFTEVDLNEELTDKDIVAVGVSKGKGFAGVMKKWHFKGSMATRGQSNKPRAPGSIGSQSPGRVLPGKKMAGRMGNRRVTIKGLKILKVVPSEKHIYVSGPVPGARNASIEIKVL